MRWSELEKDLYQILGVPNNASSDEIKKAYRKLAKQYHPDTAPSDKREEYEAKMKEINAAYSILSDPDKRAKYDSSGFNGFTQDDFDFIFDLRNIFGEDMFSDFFHPGHGHRGRIRGSDIQITLERDLSSSWREETRNISYKQMIACNMCRGTGASKVDICSTCKGTGFIGSSNHIGGVFFQYRNVCSKCGGLGKIVIETCSACEGNGVIPIKQNLQVTIPKGAVSECIVMRNMGNNEHGNNFPGDLIIRLKPIIPPGYGITKGENTLYYTMEIPVSTALLGGKHSFVHPLGHEVTVNIPMGTEEGSHIEVHGEGLPIKDSGENGTLVAYVKIAIPEKLSSEQIAAVRGLQEVGL